MVRFLFADLFQSGLTPEPDSLSPMPEERMRIMFHEKPPLIMGTKESRSVRSRKGA